MIAMTMASTVKSRVMSLRFAKGFMMPLYEENGTKLNTYSLKVHRYGRGVSGCR